MNRIQRIILGTTASVIALMTLFPPYEVILSGQRLSAGYTFLFNLPSSVSGYEGTLPANVDAKTLLVQIFATTIVGFLLLLATKTSQKT
jgi:hypothetical protein